MSGTRPPSADPAYRLDGFTLTVEYRGAALGGNNIQVVVGAPTSGRYRLDEDVAIWLSSKWWVTLRNQFAAAPDVARTILESVTDELAAFTSRASTARGAEADALTRELFAMTFHATGPDYWR